MEELYLYGIAICLSYTGWFHVFTTYFYMFALALIPHPVGIIIIKIILSSLIVGYAVGKFHEFYPKYSRYLILPFCLPVIVSMNLSLMRCCIYAWFLLFFFLNVIFKYLDKSRPTFKDIILWAVLGGIVTAWRSEAIIYIVGIPLLLGVLFYKQLNMKKTIVFFMIFLTLGIKFHYNDSLYKLASLHNAARTILSSDFKSDNKEQDLKKLNRVVDVEKFLENSCYTLVEPKCLQTNSTEEEKSQAVKILFKLTLLNFPQVFKNQIQDFIIMSKTALFLYMPDIFDGVIVEWPEALEVLNFRDKPFNKTLRWRVYNILVRNYTHDFTYWIWFLFILFISGAAAKNKLLLLISGLLILNTIVLIMTIPYILLHYFSPTYLCAVVFITMFTIVNAPKPDNNRQCNQCFSQCKGPKPCQRT